MNKVTEDTKSKSETETEWEPQDTVDEATELRENYAKEHYEEFQNLEYTQNDKARTSRLRTYYHSEIR